MKVSIFCTAYNHEKYISQALDSFLAQETDFDYEIIVTDDASTDSTPGILEEYAQNYPEKIRWFHQEKNLFSQGGINMIYETVMYPNARGQYIAFCEGDDYWCDPHKLQIQVDYLDANPDCSACVHNSWYHYCESNRADELLVPESEDKDISFGKIIQGLNNAFHTSSIMARKEFIVNTTDFEETAAKYGFLDYPWAINLALNGRVHFIDKPMSVYRVNSIAESWRSGYDYNYGKKTGFVEGEIAMMKTLLPHLEGEEKELTEKELLKREYELDYLEGKAKELINKKYKSIYKNEPVAFKVKTMLKVAFPHLHEKYRKKQGYTK